MQHPQYLEGRAGGGGADKNVAVTMLYPPFLSPSIFQAQILSTGYELCLMELAGDPNLSLWAINYVC